MKESNRKYCHLAFIIASFMLWSASSTLLASIEILPGDNKYFLTENGETTSSEATTLSMLLQENPKWLSPRIKSYQYKHVRGKKISAWTKVEINNSSEQTRFTAHQLYQGVHIRAWVVTEENRLYSYVDSDLNNETSVFTPDRHFEINIPRGRSTLYAVNLYKPYAVASSSLVLWNNPSSFYRLQMKYTAIYVAITSVLTVLGFSSLIFSLLTKTYFTVFYSLCFIIAPFSGFDPLVTGNILVPNRYTDFVYNYLTDASLYGPWLYTFFICFLTLSLLPAKKWLIIPVLSLAIITTVMKFTGSHLLHGFAVSTIHVSTLTFLTILIIARRDGQRHLWYFVIGHGASLAGSLYYTFQFSNVIDYWGFDRYSMIYGLLLDAMIVGLYVARRINKTHLDLKVKRTELRNREMLTKIQEDHSQKILADARIIERQTKLRASIKLIQDNDPSPSNVAKSLDEALANALEMLPYAGLLLTAINNRNEVALTSHAGSKMKALDKVESELSSLKSDSETPMVGVNLFNVDGFSGVLEQKAYDKRDVLGAKVSSVRLAILSDEEPIKEDLELLDFVLTHATSAIMISLMLEYHNAMSFVNKQTGFYNGDYVDHFFKEVERRLSRENIKFTILVIDLNNLKIINDNFGHDVGDQIIKLVSTCISSNLRASDIPFRPGGDEFMVYLPNAGREEGETLAERIKTTASKTRLETVIGGRDVSLPFVLSIGVASRGEDVEMDSPKEVRNEADVRMYADKEKSKSENPIDYLSFLNSAS